MGYIEGNNFVEGNKAEASLVLKRGDKMITADNFIDEVGIDAALLGSINDATYGCAAYYYDESANKVFEEIGTSRNNFTSEDDFEEKMNELMGEGSDVGVNSVSLVEVTEENADGTTETRQRSLVGFRLWGRTESDTTEAT